MTAPSVTPLHSLRPLLVLLLGLPTVAEGQARDSVPPTTKKLEELVVSSTRSVQPGHDLPTPVTVIGPEAIATSPGATTLGILGRIPGFTLRDFSHPQLVRQVRSAPSFRGLGGTSASRTLLLLDGVPANDPFTSWVLWSRVPLSLVERVEVVRSGGAMAWGSRALGGVINMITRNPTGRSLETGVELGERGNQRVSLAGTVRTGKLGVMVAGDRLATDGYVTVDPARAGPVDLPRGARTQVGFGRVTYDATRTLKFHASATYADDDETGVTPLSIATGNIAEVRSSATWTPASGDVVTVQAHRMSVERRLANTGINSTRTTETRRTDVTNPADIVGASGQWTRQMGRHRVAAGTDLSWTDGEFTELSRYQSTVATRERAVAAGQQIFGAFVTDAVALGTQTTMQLGLRVDRVSNGDARRIDRDRITNAVLRDTTFGGRAETPVTYTLGLRHRLSDLVQLHASHFRAFRNPALFEMHVPTQVAGGTAFLEVNPDLRAERLSGVEFGIGLDPSPTLSLRTTGFWNRVTDQIIDFTVGTATATGQIVGPCGALNAGQVCRQRRNIGHLRTTGVEAELDWRPLRAVAIALSYGYNPTEISAPGQAIDGNEARGAIRQAGSAAVTFDLPKVAMIVIDARHVSSRWDDDRNLIELDPFTIVGVHVSKTLTAGVTGYVRLENVTDARYEVTRDTQGLAELGGPRWITAGMKARW
jgi:iron complex outermembrane recepter protein